MKASASRPTRGERSPVPRRARNGGAPWRKSATRHHHAGLRWARAAALALAALVAGNGAVAAGPEPRVTLLEGAATLLDGIRRVQVVPGVPLPGRAIVETAEDARLVRIEWPDGQVADLGPSTRVMIDPPGLAPRGGSEPALYLMDGWVKQASADGKPSRGLVTPRLAVQPFDGALVVHASPDESLVFVEAGSATLAERGGAASDPIAARSGSLYARQGAAAGVLRDRAPSAQLQRVPRSFRDPLPLRFDRVASPKEPPPALPTPSYADLQPWLTAEAPLRAGFTRRFMPLLRDKAFRRDLDRHLKEHEEWRPILHPPPPPRPPPAPVVRNPSTAASVPPGAPPGTLPDGSRPYPGAR